MAMQTLVGINPITGYVISAPEAPPFEVHGGPVDPKHGQWGETARPYPWENYAFGTGPHGPYGLENQLLGDATSPEKYTFGAGQLSEDPTADLTPSNHAAPYPREGPLSGDGSASPDDVARQLVQSQIVHGTKMGSGRRRLYDPTMEAHNDQWTDFYEYNPGASVQAKVVPPQIGVTVGGWGSRDRQQSLARQNEYGFDSAHMHRRYATGPIPGNFMWMNPGSRPMVRTFTGSPQQFPTGTDSPFTGQDTGTAYSGYGAILTATPTEYVAPPEPNVIPAPDYGSGESMPTIAWY